MNKDQENFSLEALRAGDRAEFARVVDAYSKMIYRVALKMVHNPQDAEDILQETFIKAFNNIDTFRGNAKISTWLYSIATNEALMFLRQKKDPHLSLQKTRTADDGQKRQQFKFVDWCCLPEKELMSSEAMEYLDRAIEQLTEAKRAVFVLRDIEGLSTRETAKALDISTGAVKTRLSRARMRLRELLAGYYGRKLAALKLEEDRVSKSEYDGKKL
jgi:RNA polymerase sigma-70 factor (ECF subfamily)